MAPHVKEELIKIRETSNRLKLEVVKEQQFYLAAMLRQIEKTVDKIFEEEL